MTFSLRKASPDDTAALESLIAESARGLSRPDYTDAQIEAALGTAWGLDTELGGVTIEFVPMRKDQG